MSAEEVRAAPGPLRRCRSRSRRARIAVPPLCRPLTEPGLPLVACLGLQFKAKGNAALQAKNFDEAVEMYTKASGSAQSRPAFAPWMRCSCAMFYGFDLLALRCIA